MQTNFPAKYFIEGACANCKKLLKFNTYTNNFISKEVNGCDYGICIRCYEFTCSECLKKTLKNKICLNCFLGGVENLFSEDAKTERILQLLMKKTRKRKQSRCALESSYSPSFDELYKNYGEFDAVFAENYSTFTNQNTSSFQKFEECIQNNTNNIQLKPIIERVEKEEKNSSIYEPNQILDSLFNKIIETIPEENRLTFQMEEEKESFSKMDFSFAERENSFLKFETSIKEKSNLETITEESKPTIKDILKKKNKEFIENKSKYYNFNFSQFN